MGTDTAIILDGEHLEPRDVCRVADGAPVRLGAAARRQLERARAAVLRATQHGDALYGINTGFGPFARQRISPADLDALQVNLVRSHAAGYGAPLPRPVVRAMMVLRAHSLAHGYSGVGPEVVEALLGLLEHDIVPVVPETGSVGASGDLAPLAHVARALIGEGDVFVNGRRQPARVALEAAGLQPHRLRMKEGLALINGTQYMTAHGVLASEATRELLAAAEVAAAMSIEALLGTTRSLDTHLHALRRHPGQQRVAADLRRLLLDSPIVASHATCQAVQDVYSLRCAPQILGASVDTLEWVEAVLRDEIDAVTDNPLVFPDDDRVISGGNFHGQPVAMVLDMLALALAEIASVAERRLFHLLYNRDVPTLPNCLTPNPGLESGLMIVQYTAAALVSDTRTRCHPAVLDNVVTAGGTEDHNSFGSVAAARLPRILENVRGVVAAELLAAAAALEFHAPLQPAAPTAAALAAIRQHVEPRHTDRSVAPDLEILSRPEVLRGIVAAATSVCGPLAIATPRPPGRHDPAEP